MKKSVKQNSETMLSPRTQLAVIAYSSVFPHRIVRAPPSPIPGFGVNEVVGSRPHSTKFVELDVNDWSIPRLRRKSAVFDRLVVWTAVHDPRIDENFLCLLELDIATLLEARMVLNPPPKDDPVIVTPKFLYMRHIPFDEELARWLGSSRLFGKNVIKDTWSVYPLAPEIKICAQTASEARLPVALLR